MSGAALHFGAFRLDPQARTLLRDGAPVRLTPLAFDLLRLLAGRAGEVVPKEDILAGLWPDAEVGESNIRVHLTALRKALGEGVDGARYIENVPLRGYCFVASLRPDGATPAPPAIGPALPARLQRMLGRDAALQALRAQLAQHRFVSLVGPGGVGKTTLALGVAEALAPGLADGVRFVDLAPVADGALVASALAAAIGLPLIGHDPLPALLAQLKDKRLLLVLDNCEHVLDAAAALAQTLLARLPGVCLLATSRAPLRAEGERLYRLAPLDLPPAGAALDAQAALGFAAVRLFDERARAAQQDFALQDHNLAAVVAICQRLDGLPLAIELAAARVGVFGVHELARLLDERLSVLSAGRRTAQPRQSTLQATLDWSYQLLDPGTRLLLRAFGSFAGSFSADSALALAASGGVPRVAALQALHALVDSSLLATDVLAGHPHYRLLDMTRSYAREALQAEGETGAVAARHARLCLALLQGAQAQWAGMARADWIALFGRRVDDVRQALQWSFGPSGDAALGVALSVAAGPIWFQLSMMGESQRGAERALAALAQQASPDPRAQMLLQAQLGLALAHVQGPGAPAQVAACAAALAIAQRIGDTDQQMQMLYRLWHADVGKVEYGLAMDKALAFQRICAAHGTAQDTLVGHRMMMIGEHCLGRHVQGLHHADQLLAYAELSGERATTMGSPQQVDDKVMALAYRGRLLWLTGHSDEGWAVCQEGLAVARARGHDLSMFQALALSSAIVALWRGDAEGAHRVVDELHALAVARGIGTWLGWTRLYRTAMARRFGTEEDFHGLPGVAQLPYTASQLEHLATLADGFASPEMAQRAQAVPRKWFAPEALRAHAVMLWQGGDAAGAEPWLWEALRIAREHAAFGWELRTATSLAGVLRARGRGAEGRAMLDAVLGQCRQGFQSADVAAAREALKACEGIVPHAGEAS